VSWVRIALFAWLPLVVDDVYGHLFPDAEEDQAVMQQLQQRLIG
jgi:hypothetical protein